MVMAGKENAGKINFIKTSNKTFKGVESFKYFGTTTNKAKFHS